MRIGHKGNQVRDNLDARDLAEMFWHFYQNPRSGAVYHAGGGRERSCSVLETMEAVLQPSATRSSPDTTTGP